MNQQLHYPEESVRPNQHKSAGGTREEHQESVLVLPLSRKKRSAKTCLAMQSSTAQPLSLSVESFVYSLQTSHVLHWSCVSPCVWPQHVSLSQLTSLCQSAREAARTCSMPPEVSWCGSLYGVSTNGAQLHSVRQANTCVLLAKYLLSCLL